jgi:hypothetical protein
MRKYVIKAKERPHKIFSLLGHLSPASISPGQKCLPRPSLSPRISSLPLLCPPVMVYHSHSALGDRFQPLIESTSAFPRRHENLLQLLNSAMKRCTILHTVVLGDARYNNGQQAIGNKTKHSCAVFTRRLFLGMFSFIYLGKNCMFIRRRKTGVDT